MAAVQKKFKYLKLGDKVNTFYDPTTDLSISNKQVKRVVGHAHTFPQIKKGLETGHLKEATIEEWEAYKELAQQHETNSLNNLPTDPKKVVGEGAAAAYEKKADLKKGKGADAEDEDDEDEPEEEDEENEDPDEEDDEELSKSEMIDALKVSPLIKEEEKKNLTKLGDKKLKELYLRIFPKTQE